MRMNGRGDTGFMEAMLATMIAVTVLAAYLGVAANTAVVSVDPTGALDAAEFTGAIRDGVFEPGYAEYLLSFMDTSGCPGVSVSVTVPGEFCAPPETMVIGDMDGSLFSRTFTSMVEADGGRRVPAVFEVVVCA